MMKKIKRISYPNKKRRQLSAERAQVARFCRKNLIMAGRKGSEQREAACVFVENIFKRYCTTYPKTAIESVTSFGRMLPEHYRRTVRTRDGIVLRAVLGVQWR